jgi:Holliday junction DNA helicase RuvA
MIARITGYLEQLDDGAALVALEGGVAHEVLVPAYLADRLMGKWGGGAGSVGGTVTLHTLEYLESQNQGASFIPRLIGFASPTERDFFELLTTVKGLGNKRALRSMALEPATIARSIHERDTRALQRLPEIGPKLAELIVHELKGKVERFVHMASPLNPDAPGMPAAAVEPKSAPLPASPGDKTPGKKPRVRLGDGQGAASESVATAEPVATPSTPPIRQTVETLIALGEAPAEAERLVARALDRARAAGGAIPVEVPALLTAAYASR